jgi:HNH endonuclease
MALTHPVDSRAARAWTCPRRCPNDFREFPGSPMVILMTMVGGPVWFDEVDLPRVRKYHWTRCNGAYVQGRRLLPVSLDWAGQTVDFGSRTQRVYLARLIADPEEDEVVVHRNRDKRDFRRDNLLCVGRREFHSWQAAVSPRRRPGYKGVRRFCPGRFDPPAYAARIGTTELGRFPTPEEAARAYDQAARARYGAAAWLNFPEER